VLCPHEIETSLQAGCHSYGKNTLSMNALLPDKHHKKSSTNFIVLQMHTNFIEGGGMEQNHSFAF
jgi:hypothetical protein